MHTFTYILREPYESVIKGYITVPSGTTNGWVPFQPYNIFYIDHKISCESVTYYITNITNVGYNNTIYFKLYDESDSEIIYCDTICNFSIDCAKIQNSNKIVAY